MELTDENERLRRELEEAQSIRVKQEEDLEELKERLRKQTSALKKATSDQNSSAPSFFCFSS